MTSDEEDRVRSLLHDKDVALVDAYTTLERLMPRIRQDMHETEQAVLVAHSDQLTMTMRHVAEALSMGLDTVT